MPAGQNSDCMPEIFLKQDILKEDYQKTIKSYFFSFEPSLFSVDKIMKYKRDLELVTSRFSGYKTSSEKSLYW